MSADLHNLLDRGVAPRPTTVDGDALVARGIRRRRTKRSAASALVAIAVLAGGAIVADLGQAPDVPFVGDAPDAAQLEWTSLGKAPVLPRERSVTAVDGDRVVFWGGEGGDPDEDYELDGVWQDTVELQDGVLYDATTDEWTAIGSAPSLSPRFRPAVSLVGDSVLVWGGRGATPIGPGGTLFAADLPNAMDGAVYDLKTATWRSIPTAPLATRTPAATTWDGNELLVWGGTGNDGRVFADGAAWTAERGWEPIASFPLAPREGSAIGWDGARLAVWGGGTNLDPIVGVELLYADGAVYDRSTDAWTTMADVDLVPGWFSYNDAAPRALLRDGRFLVIGGARTSPALKYQLDGAWFDLSTGDWSPITPAPDTATYVEPDRFGAIAVERSETSRSVTMWFYEPDTDAWIRTSATEQRASVRTNDRLVLFSDSMGLGSRGEWRPVTVIDSFGAATSPVLIDGDRRVGSRSFSAVAALDSGVVLFGGLGEEETSDGGFNGTGHLNTAWFLPFE